MAQVSLIDTAAQLGKTSGQIKLSELRTNGYTRTFSGTGYLRVSPFEVEAGDAQDPEEAGNEHRLGDWLGYFQSFVPPADDLAASGGYGTADLTWDQPAGYSRAPAIVSQTIYIKDTGETEFNSTSLSVDPFTSPDQTADPADLDNDDVDVSTYEGNVIAIGIKIEFDDSVTTHESIGAPAADGQQTLIGAGDGVALKVVNAVPSIDSIEQLTEEDECVGGCNDCVDIRINVTMEGPSTGTIRYRIDGGSFQEDPVGAGATGILMTLDAGVSIEAQLKYDDVGTYSALTDEFNTVCILT